MRNLLLFVLFFLSACGEEEVRVDRIEGLDSTEMFTGGAGVEGQVSSKLDPALDVADIPKINPAEYSFAAADKVGLVKYETSKVTKKKIRAFMDSKIGDTGSYTFQNDGSFGAFSYVAQGLFIPSGKISAYELKAIFVRNEAGISMLYDYGLRWQCRGDDSRQWRITPCA